MNWLTLSFIIVSFLLIGAVLIQSRSAGMSGAFGGGAEGFHVRATVILSILFIALAAAHLFVK